MAEGPLVTASGTAVAKCNEKGRTTQNTAEQSTVKVSNAFKILKFSVSVMTSYTYVFHAS